MLFAAIVCGIIAGVLGIVAYHAPAWGSHTEPVASLERRMAAADRALYAVDPELAVELGYVPPEERLQVCAYCDESHQAKDMLVHQEYECEPAQEAKRKELEQRERDEQYRKLLEKQLQAGGATQNDLARLLQRQMMNQVGLGQMHTAMERQRAAQRGVALPPSRSDLSFGDALLGSLGRGLF